MYLLGHPWGPLRRPCKHSDVPELLTHAHGSSNTPPWMSHCPHILWDAPEASQMSKSWDIQWPLGQPPVSLDAPSVVLRDMVSVHGNDGLMVGPDDPGGLFQPSDSSLVERSVKGQ